MTNFSHLKKLEVSSDVTKEYVLEELEGEPTLILRPANESNPKYMNAQLRATSRKGMRKARKGIDSEDLKRLRKNDRTLYPDHVIVGWKGIVDNKGKAVKFTPEAATEFVAALPDWVFDGIRTFAVIPENFVDVIDSEGKAGN